MTALRIAYIGATPLDVGGLPYVATQLIVELAGQGAEIDCYVTLEEDLPARLHKTPGVRLVSERLAGWAWASSNPLIQFLTWQTARLRAQRRLVKRLLREHRRRPYDLVYQCSQIEMPALMRHRAALPPIVVHPGVHAAGQLRRHRREAALARRCEPIWMRVAVRGMLRGRSAAQGRSLARVAAVVAPSRRFARLIREDYGVPEHRLYVVPNPVDLGLFRPAERPAPTPGRRRTILFVSRIAVGKGTELVIELSRRLADMRGSVRIEVIGDDSMWSDYRALLADLDTDVASYCGPLPAHELAERYRQADLLVQPSHCDAFGLTVAEALASGVPVVASDAVGAIEDVSTTCCAVFPAGNVEAFELAVREVLERMEGSREVALRASARQEAVRMLAPETVARQLMAVLRTISRSSGETEGVLP